MALNQYQILFKGEVLPGFDFEATRANAAKFLKAGPSQLAQLFSGQLVSLRKGLSVNEAARYRSSLKRMGLRVHVRQLPPPSSQTRPAQTLAQTQAPADPQTNVVFRVVYAGEVLKGLSRQIVMGRVARKLQLDDARLSRLFSGKKAILKQGLTAEQAAQYLSDAAELGMLASMEFDVVVPKQARSKLKAPTVSTPALDAAAVERRFMESAIKTQLRNPAAPLYTPQITKARPNDTTTVVDVDLTRLAYEEAFAMPGPMLEPLEPPMPQVKIWRAPDANAISSREQISSNAVPTETQPSKPAHPSTSTSTPALRSIELHVAPLAETSKRGRTQALRHLMGMGAQLPKKIAQLFQ